MDGSQKMPQRIFSSIHEAKKQSRSTELLTVAVDEWFEFLWSSRGKVIDDPLAAEMMKNADSGVASWKSSMKKRFDL